MDETGRPRIAAPEAALGVGVLAFAGIMVWQIRDIPPSPLYAQVGPTLFPYVAAGGIGLLGVLLVLQAVRGGWQPDEEKEVALDWRAMAFVVAGLVANVALITFLGFSAASTVMFVLVAYGFGSGAILRNAAIGFALSIFAYFGFAKLLGVNIGAGPVETWIERLVSPITDRLFGG